MYRFAMTSQQRSSICLKSGAAKRHDASSLGRHSGKLLVTGEQRFFVGFFVLFLDGFFVFFHDALLCFL